MRTVNNKIACTPFPDMGAKKTLEGAGPVKVMRIESTKALTSLEVLMEAPDLDVGVGDVVYLRSDLMAMPWAKEVHKTLDGTPFILVPFDRVEIVG